MVAGLISDIPTVSALITRIMADAEAIIADRLMGLMSPNSVNRAG